MLALRGNDPNSGDPLAALRAFAGLLGVAGFLSLIGYIGTVAHKDMLGTQISVASVTELGFAAGDFLLESFLVVLECCTTHYVWTIVLAAIVATIWCFRHFSADTDTKWRRTSDLAILLLGVAGIGWVLLGYELPTASIHGTLIGLDVCAQPNVADDGFLHHRAHQLWALLALSRGYSNGCPALDQIVKTERWVDARSTLVALHATSIFIVGALWLELLFQRKASLKWLRLCQMTAIALLVISTLLLPYAHGKIIASTTARRANLIVKPSPEDIANGAAAANARPLRGSSHHDSAAAPDRSPCPARCLDVYILSEDDKTLFFAYFDGRLSRVYAWPKDGYEHYEVIAMEDVLKERIKRGVPR